VQRDIMGLNPVVYSILFFSILFYSILFYSILYYGDVYAQKILKYINSCMDGRLNVYI